MPRVELHLTMPEEDSPRTHNHYADHAGDAGPAYGVSPDSTVKFKPKTKLRILVLLNQTLMPPDKLEEGVEIEKQPWRTEYDVISTLKSMDHEVIPVGLYSDLQRDQQSPRRT